MKDEEKVKQNWEKLKLKRRKQSLFLAGVPKSLPPIIKAYRIQEKVKGIGFEFALPKMLGKKVDEELSRISCRNQSRKKEQELGDVFFSLINYARISGLNADSAGTNQS